MLANQVCKLARGEVRAAARRGKLDIGQRLVKRISLLGQARQSFLAITGLDQGSAPVPAQALDGEAGAAPVGPVAEAAPPVVVTLAGCMDGT